MKHIGFTGAGAGLTDAQRQKLYGAIAFTDPPVTLHHGCAIGADAAAHSLARHCGWRVVGYPCSIASQRAGCECDETRPARPPLVRNRDIVDATSLLVACPAGPEEMRSGTWATVRYARKQGKPIVIVWPDGNVTREAAP